MTKQTSSQNRSAIVSAKFLDSDNHGVLRKGFVLWCYVGTLGVPGDEYP